VQLVTVPVVPYAGDPTAELSWEQPQSDRMFRALEADRDLPTSAKGNGKAKAAAAASAEPTVSPAKVSVQVLNGSGVNGVAGSAATALTAKGFTVTGTGPAANYSYPSTTIQYSSAAQLPEVNTLKAALGSVVAQQDTALGAGSINLILGSNYHGLSTGKSAAKSSAKTLSNLAKSYGGITANANICKDSAAFAGPDNPLPGG
jgi:hypothetical protein